MSRKLANGREKPNGSKRVVLQQKPETRERVKKQKEPKTFKRKIVLDNKAR